MWMHPERTSRAARRLLALAVALCVAAAACSVARADEAASPLSQDVAPVASLFKRVHATFPGRILTVELALSDPPAYEVKLLTENGNVLKLSYDALTLRLEGVVGLRERDNRDDADGAIMRNGRDDDDDDDDDDDRDDDDGGSNSGPGGGGDNSGPGGDDD
jgi:hypothetical protein